MAGYGPDRWEAVDALLRDAQAGHLDRRQFFRRTGSLGLSVGVAGALRRPAAAPAARRRQGPRLAGR